MNELDQLYQQVILDHSRERHGSGALDAPDATSHQVNPTCGDEVTLGVRVRDGRIEAVGWEGDGCSISQASISVMHDLVDGADLASVGHHGLFASGVGGLAQHHKAGGGLLVGEFSGQHQHVSAHLAALLLLRSTSEAIRPSMPL